MKEISGIKPSENALTTRDFTVADPHDLAPVDQILSQIIDDEIAKAKDSGETVIFLTGEAHPLPTHKMTQVGMLNHLSAWQKTWQAEQNISETGSTSPQYLFAMELPYNFLQDVSAPYTIPMPLLEAVLNADPSGHTTLNLALADNQFLYAPLSTERLFQTAIRLGAPVAMVDTAKKITNSMGGNTIKFPFQVIDPEDPALPQATETLREKFNLVVNPAHMIPTIVGDGTALRNTVMVERTLAEATKRNINVVMQQCGLIHALGYNGTGKEYRYSLAAQYKEAGCRVVPVFLAPTADEPGNVLEAQALADHPETVIIRGLDNERFIGEPDKEKAYMDRLTDSYSDAVCPFAKEDPLPTIEEARTGLATLINRVLTGLNPS